MHQTLGTTEEKPDESTEQKTKNRNKKRQHQRKVVLSDLEI